MKGTIYTFYSYKGGVGRSMALANIGMYFFKQGFTTLLIDWDLEAPGLERYFCGRYRLDQEELNDRPGLCDMIKSYVDKIARPPSEDNNLPYPNIADYIYKLDTYGNAELLLLHAGRRVEGKPWQDYASFVQNFDWVSFYRDCGGGIYLEWLREQLKQHFDVVLIDSRTGVTEMGGVATQHLSDVVILVCGSNSQNIENTARMCLNFTGDAVKKARGGRPLEIIVTPSRVDDADSEGFGRFHKRLKTAFERIPMRALDDGYSLEEMLIPYLARFSYDESLVIGDPEAETVASRLVQAYRNIAANMKSLSDQQSALHAGSTGSVDSTQPKVFLAYARGDESVAHKIHDYLSHNQILVSGGDQGKLKHEISPDEIAKANSVLILVSSNAIRSRTLQNLVRQCEELSKPIIPMLMENVVTPLWLSDRVFVDFNAGFERGLELTTRAIKALSAPAPISKSIEGSSENLIYISHSIGDSEIAGRISTLLKERGFKIWIGMEQLLPGMPLQSSIEDALNRAAVLIVLVSRNSVDSKFVTQEWSYMQGSGKPVIPLILDQSARVPFRLADLLQISLDPDFDQGISQLIESLHRLISERAI
jgi:septum formation inhibitor-activating ATPase MinD